MTNLEFKLTNLKKAHAKLVEACDLYQPGDELIRDSMIQRFEFTYELTHKTLQEFIGYMGITLENKFPRTIYKKAYQNGIVNDEGVWLSLMADRNATSHIYSEGLANEVASRIQSQYVTAIGHLISNMEKNL